MNMLDLIQIHRHAQISSGSLHINLTLGEKLSSPQAQSEEQKHQIEALTAQLEHLTASKAQLESRCPLLEKVVKMREAPIDANPQARLWSSTAVLLSCHKTLRAWLPPMKAPYLQRQQLALSTVKAVATGSGIAVSSGATV